MDSYLSITVYKNDLPFWAEFLLLPPKVFSNNQWKSDNLDGQTITGPHRPSDLITLQYDLPDEQVFLNEDMDDNLEEISAIMNSLNTPCLNYFGSLVYYSGESGTRCFEPIDHFFSYFLEDGTNYSSIIDVAFLYTDGTDIHSMEDLANFKKRRDPYFSLPEWTYGYSRIHKMKKLLRTTKA